MIYYNIIVKSNHWPKRLRNINNIIKLVLKQKKMFNLKKNVSYYINFVLVNDVKIKKFNKMYKKINKSTDVLTFVSEIKNKIKNIEKHCDVMISAETLSCYAKKNKINFYDHVAHLIIHSILHISGYKHQKKKDLTKMKNKEINILRNLGISNSYH